MALDVGEKRVGVAIASSLAKLPRPFTTLDYEKSIEKIKTLANQEGVGTIVVGLPLNRHEEATKQTEFTRAFMERLTHSVEAKIDTCSEALSSARAKRELETRGKAYEKSDIDALAAAYILEDYLKERP
ncbi:MAG: Holliday junction resolvase RuvX [Candidatus Saccharibacteria bacterium]|nr:Holliday junction resolvase RuvX [Candidatus Saccharibacteria bacterium]